jgi:survival-of-motor-neuron-related-splicing factor 30
MADIKAIKDQIWYIKRDIQNEEKKRDEWANTVSPSWRCAPSIQ